LSHALIVGASRGIGLEFVRQYRTDGWQVTATARSDAALAELKGLGATALALDVASAESASRLARQIEGAVFDVVVYVAGIFGPRTTGLEPPTEADFDSVMHTNLLGAMRVLPQVVEMLAPGAKLAVISSRMASIELRAGPRGWLYGASKAALNSVLKDVSLALAGRAICVTLSPGWVRTDMGGASAALEVSESVANLRRTLAALTAADTGRFLNHDGDTIAW